VFNRIRANLVQNGTMLRKTILGAAICVLASGAFAQEVQQTIRINAGGGDMGPMSVLPPGRQPKVGTARLRGRVLAGDTGAALRRAQVRISSPDIGTKTALTDTQGRFEFRDLPAGRFNVSVSKSGFVSMQYGQSRPFEPGRPIELTDAQLMDKADVALPRGSVLAGRVVDEFGEAVAEADVTAMRMQFQNGRRRLVPSGRNASTNDLGQFRIYGLPPGEYYVSATLRNMTTMMLDMAMGGAGAVAGSTGSNQQSGYASTYYPSAPNPGEAQRVAVAVGQELATVDIQLQPVKLARISGMALGSDGKPMSGAMVMMMPSVRDAMLFGPGNTARTDKDGNFTLNGVTPGEYTLQVQSMGGIFQSAGGNVMTFAFATSTDGPPAPPGANAPQQREFGVAAVNVAGEDITGLLITGTRGAKASGTVTFLGGVKPEGAATMRVTAPSTDMDTNLMPGAGAAQVKEPGTFELDSLVGGHTFRVGNLPRGWVLKRVTFNGDDITDRGLEFKAGQDIEGIEIELTNKPTAITGSVAGTNGAALKDYTVVVFAEDQEKWTLPQNRWMASARPDQEGQFRFGNLPPGEYYAIAVEYVAQGEWQDPAWLERAAKAATKFTLDEGGTKTLSLKLSAS
jgi:Carboxypeptidase regulatory-like domain